MHVGGIEHAHRVAIGDAHDAAYEHWLNSRDNAAHG